MKDNCARMLFDLRTPSWQRHNTHTHTQWTDRRQGTEFERERGRRTDRYRDGHTANYSNSPEQTLLLKTFPTTPSVNMKSENMEICEVS